MRIYIVPLLCDTWYIQTPYEVLEVVRQDAEQKLRDANVRFRDWENIPAKSNRKDHNKMLNDLAVYFKIEVGIS